MNSNNNEKKTTFIDRYKANGIIEAYGVAFRCSNIKKEGSSCSSNTNCKYPKCNEVTKK